MPLNAPSAEEHTVAEHFKGKEPGVRAVYDRILAVASGFGPVEEDPKKTSIHLNRKSAFAGIETRKTYLLLNVKTDYGIDSPRAVQAEQVSRSRFHTKIKLSAPEEVDAEVERWLQDAYAISV